MLKEIQYRTDIQILRGIAVMLVILFHLGISSFGSGFLGVDVFFVISGYLMAVMYDPQKKRDFFLKRAKRLLPAYFCVVIAVLVIAVFVTKPSEYNQVSKQTLFATVFASNIGFWLDNSYFDKAAFKPLLHLWSLGVELQFYLLVPFLYWIFSKSRILFLLVLISSALLCFMVVDISPKTAFFLLPFRLWEFLLGFLVAKILSGRLRSQIERAKWIGNISFLLIIFIPFVRLKVDEPSFMQGHPGFFALLISIATAGALLFGISKRIENNPLSRLLEKIGGYSYSIYLAHFPVIVLYLYQPFSGTNLKAPSLSQFMLLIVLIIASSTILFSVVERPFRTKTHVTRWIAGSAAAVLILPLFGEVVQQVITPQKEMLIYQSWFDRDGYRCGKIKRILDPTTNSCEITGKIASPAHRILLVGNSHADSIKSTFSAVAEQANVSIYFMVENNPLMKDGMTPRRLITEAIAKRADTIVLHYSPKAIEFTILKELTNLAKEHRIKIDFIMPVPVWHKSVPAMLINSLEKGETLPFQTINEYKMSNNFLMTSLSKLNYHNFKIYPVADVFCKPDCQLISENGKPLYFDDGHLTLSGSKMLRPVFASVIADLQ